MADQLAKAATEEEPEAPTPQITEGGLEQAWKKKREEERKVKGVGMPPQERSCQQDYGDGKGD